MLIPAEFHHAIAKEWRFFEWFSQKILLDYCMVESHLNRYRRGISENVVISIVSEIDM